MYIHIIRISIRGLTNGKHNAANRNRRRNRITIKDKEEEREKKEKKNRVTRRPFSSNAASCEVIVLVFLNISYIYTVPLRALLRLNGYSCTKVGVIIRAC